ncbi:MAG: DUF4870 domain-containing protein [Armatimonadetes bacterium]|nr:DUF4870 domain-containing protein [Armatimonadota bacterium]
MFCHLSALISYAVGGMFFLGPLVVWLIKKDQFPFVNDQGKESLNFQITCFLLFCIAGILAIILIGFLLLPLVGLYHLVFTIIASMAANRGETYRYPLCLRLIK